MDLLTHTTRNPEAEQHQICLGFFLIVSRWWLQLQRSITSLQDDGLMEEGIRSRIYADLYLIREDRFSK